MATRAPHHLWLLAISWPQRGLFALACWSATSTAPRVAAMVVQRERIARSDEESLGALVAAAHGEDIVVHARWREILGREALSRKFYRGLEAAVARLSEGATGARCGSDARREIAILTASRLLFLSFLESKGWLDGDRNFLARVLDHAIAGGGRLHRCVLDPLLFGTLNTRASRRAAAARAFGRIPFLNGGLFQRTPVERQHRQLEFSDDDLAALGEHVLFRYRFTPREVDGGWSELAIDPEMLGRAFESLMASAERRASGTFYTPHALVERVTEAALREVLASRQIDATVIDTALQGGSLDTPVAQQLAGALRNIRILDPACGSGAFLVHALERLSGLMQVAGDEESETDRRRRIVAGNIFGVDINPTAVWLCELRLWLAVVLDCEVTDPLSVPPLPNLDHNVRVGDALRSPAFEWPIRDDSSSDRLRIRYAGSTGARKRILGRQLEQGERRRAIALTIASLDTLAATRRDLLAAARGPDLFGGRRGSVGDEREARTLLRNKARALRKRLAGLRRGHAVPFAFPSHFPEAALTGGFDLVLGNPPWVRLHRITADLRPELKRLFRVFREAAWERGAGDALAGKGFGAQVDLASLFLERSLSLVRAGGPVAMLLPVKLWRSLAGGGVRRLCGEWNTLRVLEDWSDAPTTFDAAVYPSVVVASRGRTGTDGTVTLGMYRRDFGIAWRTNRDQLALDASPGAPWLILAPAARKAFDRLAAAGVPLADSGLGRPTLGVKSGCNDAFLVRVIETTDAECVVTDGANQGRIERELIRPVIRGESVQRWQAAPSTQHLVFPHDAQGKVFRQLPPGARHWLGRWRRSLLARADATGAAPWWSLFRVDGALTHRTRVVWADLGRSPSALVLPAGDPRIALNSCYVLSCRDETDALALATWLNSPLAAAWLSPIAEPARGGYRRYLAWTMARLPIPQDWARAREVFAPLGRRGTNGERVSDLELLDASLRAFRLRHSTVAELLLWEGAPRTSFPHSPAGDCVVGP